MEKVAGRLVKVIKAQCRANFGRTKVKSQRDGSGINVVKRGLGAKPSSDTERTTGRVLWCFDKWESRSTKNFIRVIGNRNVTRRGLQNCADGVDPFRATDRDCFPNRGFESSRLDLRLLCCDIESRSARGRQGRTLRRCLPDPCPVYRATGKSTTRRRIQRQTTELSIAPPRLAIRSHCAVVPSRFDVTWVTQAGDLLWSLKSGRGRWGLHHGQRSNFFVAALMASSYAWTAAL